MSIEKQPADAAPTEQRVLLRRAPRLAPRLTLGVLVGVVLAFVIGLTFPSSEQISRWQAVGYLLLWTVPAGLAVAGAWYAWADWRSRRRASEVAAVTLVEHPQSDQSTSSDNPLSGQEN